MPARTTAAELLAAATEEVVGTIEQAGVIVERLESGLLRLDVDGSAALVKVVPIAYATGDRVKALTGRAKPKGPTRLVVSDRVTADARDQLRAAGWGYLDRRGHLRLRAPGLLIDTDVDAVPRKESPSHEAIMGKTGLAVAYQLLTHPDQSVSPTRSSTGFAPSSVSVAVQRMRHAGLLDSESRPLLPDLFWVVVDHWVPQRRWLVSAPDPIEAGWANPDVPGWCLTGTLAAVELGAPIASTDTAPELYVPGAADLAVASRRYGITGDPELSAASIAVAPVAAVTAQRTPPRHQPWPLAHIVAVALDLAQDRSRGRQILDDWHPPERVW